MDETQIELGDEYRDTISGFTGVAIGRHEYIHGCTRITLQAMKDGDIKEYTFDAQSLEAAASREAVTSSRTGGPRGIPPARSGE